MPKTISNPTIAILAGEKSGDQLGADLITALRRYYPKAHFVGIGGPCMRAQGFHSWHDIHELSLFGLVEVIGHIPRLLKLRRALIARLQKTKPAVVIGIDAPDFNLTVERRLKQSGLRTVHYVSPSIWAWREKRAKKIGQATHRILCLLPLEPAIYAKYGINAQFVGHPLADRFALVSDRGSARDQLSIPHDVPVLAVMPGSRTSELTRMGATFMEAARRVAAAIPGLWLLIPAADPHLKKIIRPLLANGLPLDRVMLLDGHAQQAMLASDVVLLASGTAALEAMLAKRPMVAGYRVAPLSYYLCRALRLLKTNVYTLPNILARSFGLSDHTMLVPELMQKNFTATRLADATLALFNDSQRRSAIVTAFEKLHQALRTQFDGTAADQAASLIAGLLDKPST